MIMTSINPPVSDILPVSGGTPRIDYETFINNLGQFGDLLLNTVFKPKREVVIEAPESVFDESIENLVVNRVNVIKQPLSLLDQVWRGQERGGTVVKTETCSYLKSCLNNFSGLKVRVKTHSTGSLKNTCQVDADLSTHRDIMKLIVLIRQLGFQSYQIEYGEDFSLEDKWKRMDSHTEEWKDVVLSGGRLPNAITVIPMEYPQEDRLLKRAMNLKAFLDAITTQKWTLNTLGSDRERGFHITTPSMDYPKLEVTEDGIILPKQKVGGRRLSHTVLLSSLNLNFIESTQGYIKPKQVD